MRTRAEPLAVIGLDVRADRRQSPFRAAEGHDLLAYRTFDLEPDTTPVRRALLRVLQALPIGEYL